MLSYLKLIDGTELIGDVLAEIVAGAFTTELKVQWPLSIERQDMGEGVYTGFNNLIPLQLDEFLYINTNHVVIKTKIQSPAMESLYMKSKSKLFLKALEQDRDLYMSLALEEKMELKDN